jgi:hypothetical protein
MRRPPRPFTVEIKSSRRPASLRTPVPTLVDPPRAGPLFQDLLLRDTWKVGPDRRPAQEAALNEAHHVFRVLGVSIPGPVQAAGLHAVAQQGPEVEVVAPEQPRAAGRGADPRQARVLPDLLSLSGAGAPLSPETETRLAPGRGNGSESRLRPRRPSESVLDLLPTQPGEFVKERRARGGRARPAGHHRPDASRLFGAGSDQFAAKQ